MSVAKIKKGDTVIMCGFTGMKLGVYEVVAADDKKVTVEKADGTKVSFDRKTGKQLKPKNPKYANFIIEDDGSYVNPREAAGAKKKATKKAAPKKKAPKVEEEEYEEDEELEEEEDEEEEPAPAPKKKAKAAKKPAKKAKKQVEEDEDDYEEVE